MIEYAIKQDKDLLKAAKKLFGNCVSKAYIACSLYEQYMSKQDIREELKRLKYKDGLKGQIDFCGSIIVLIINGKAIEFTSSEWGSASEFNFEEAVEF